MSARGRHLEIRRKAVETGKFPCQAERSRPFPTHMGAWVRIRRNPDEPGATPPGRHIGVLKHSKGAAAPLSCQNYFKMVSQKRIRTVAICARVAGPLGSSFPLPMPCTKPVSTAQAMASWA